MPRQRGRTVNERLIQIVAGQAHQNHIRHRCLSNHRPIMWPPGMIYAAFEWPTWGGQRNDRWLEMVVTELRFLGCACDQLSSALIGIIRTSPEWHWSSSMIMVTNLCNLDLIRIALQSSSPRNHCRSVITLKFNSSSSFFVSLHFACPLPRLELPNKKLDMRPVQRLNSIDDPTVPITPKRRSCRWSLGVCHKCKWDGRRGNKYYSPIIVDKLIESYQTSIT